MKRLTLSGILGAAAIALTLLTATPAQAAVSSWQKGVTYQPSSSSELYNASFQQAMRNAAADGANYVTLVVQLHQDNIGSTSVYAAGDTPTDGSLVSAINYVHGLGMKVMLKPHVDSYDGQWRANINPGDRNAWFSSYGTQMVHYAVLAQQNRVEELCIGAELVDMTRPDRNGTNTANWQALIAKIRGNFSGLLTYSAQRADGSSVDEVSTIGFWSSLDTIGVSAYYPLDGSSVQTMMNGWAQADTQYLAPVAARYGKPLLLTEVGYRSADNAASAPYDYNGGGPNQGLQANLYQALFSYWNNSNHFAGVQLWDWNSVGDTSYDPQGKQAEGVIKSWFGGSGASSGGGMGGGTTTPTPPVNTNPGTINDSSTSTTVTVNQPATVTVSVTAQNTASSDLVDVEIYDPNGNRVSQQVFDNQTLTAGQAWTKQITYTPTMIGAYRVKIGVFASGWGTNYNWNDNAGTITSSAVATTPVTPPVTPPPVVTTPPVTTPPVTTPPVTTPPVITPPVTTPTQPTTTNLSAANLAIWWPSNGSSVSGVQPFKARLDSVANAAYKMYWQVDGGTQNLMGDSTDGDIHKESLVDLSGWSWQPSGTYTITFMAKDSNGTTVKSQSVQIHITH